MSTTTTAPAPLAHHPEGPSQWPAFEECPDYQGERDIEEADIESLDPNFHEPADKSVPGRGQAQHGGLSKALTGMPDAFAGLSAVEEDQVRWVAKEVLEFAASMGYHSSEIRVEQRVTMYRGDSFETLYFGTLDIRFGPFIIDAKFGDERNYFVQLVGYALPIMVEENLTGMHVACFYGRLKRKRIYKLDRATAETIAYSLLAKRANPARQPRICSYCGWCTKKATCSALTGVVDTVLEKRLDWAVRLPTMSAREAGNDPVTVGAMKLIWKAYIEKWGEGVDYAAQQMAAGGIVPVGFRRQDEKGRLEITPGGAALTAMKAAGVGQEHLLAVLTHSQTSLVKAYRAQFGCSEDVAKEKVEAILVEAGVARRGEGSFKLMRTKTAEDDLRAAIARPVVGALQ